MVINMAIIGDTNVEKNKISASKEESFKKIPSTATKKTISGGNPLRNNRSKRIPTSSNDTSSSTQTNQRNFHKIIAPLETGFESIR